jgi:hypothetical protein
VEWAAVHRWGEFDRTPEAVPNQENLRSDLLSRILIIATSSRRDGHHLALERAKEVRHFR